MTSTDSTRRGWSGSGGRLWTRGGGPAPCGRPHIISATNFLTNLSQKLVEFRLHRLIEIGSMKTVFAEFHLMAATLAHLVRHLPNDTLKDYSWYGSGNRSRVQWRTEGRHSYKGGQNQVG